MCALTSRERVLAALNHRQPDRTPIFEYVLLSPVASQILGRTFEDYGGDQAAWMQRAAELGYARTLRQYAVDRVELAQMLGHDMIYCVPNPTEKMVRAFAGKDQAEADPSFRRNATKLPDDPVEHLILRNQGNIIALRLEHPEKDAAQNPNEIYDLLREEMARRDLDLPIYAPAFFHGIWTDVDLMQTMMLAPEVAHEHFQLMTELALRHIRQLLALDIDMIGIGGDFAGNRPIISPEAYHTFIMPELFKLSTAIHAGGKFACNASDGNLLPVIDDFLIGSGVDAYGEVDFGAGMDLCVLKERFGGKITLIGNIDSGNVLSFYTSDDIARLTIDCLKAGWGNGGHLFTASNAITASVPISHYLAMVNAYRKFFDLPLFSLDSMA